MRALALSFALLATPALADISAEIGQTGLAATEARLAALASPSDEEKFALGGVRFLRTVEGALQTRWKAGLTDRLGMLPFLRLPIDENPTPDPFDPGVIAGIFRGVTTGMDSARAPLAEVPETSDFGLVISLGDLWFDVNANAVRDPGEDLMTIAGPMILGWRWGDRDPATPAPVIRFDAADAAWLSAYTHLLGGISEVVLAYDPTPPITRIMGARAEMAKLAPLEPDPLFDGGAGEGPDSIDLAAMVLATLNQTPDAARSQAAHAHFLSMITDNRTFWTRVAKETDNDREWLPNDSQKSALGIEVPPGTGAVWQGVLADAEALLRGERLAPYWRLGDGAGLNVGRILTEPRPIDLIGWIQGVDALPYLEKGPVVNAASWGAFENLVGGEAMLFSVFLN